MPWRISNVVARSKAGKYIFVLFGLGGRGGRRAIGVGLWLVLRM